MKLADKQIENLISPLYIKTNMENQGSLILLFFLLQTLEHRGCCCINEDAAKQCYLYFLFNGKTIHYNVLHDH